MASKPYEITYEVTAEDFSRAGEAAGDVKKTLKQLGFSSEVVRRVSISMYEAEINMVIHADGGQIVASISPDEITVVFKDKGPGIPDIEKAMQEGFSTASEKARSLGFGAGMGLPNIKRYTDKLEIDTEVGVGTTMTMTVYPKGV